MGMILVSGATGFVGSALTSELLYQGIDVVAAVRNKYKVLPHQVTKFEIGQSTDADIPAYFDDVTVAIHLAARAHIMNDVALDPLTEFRKVNTEGTLSLARQAARSGVRRFIFISSIKVNGEETQAGEAFTENDDFVPDDPYGLSKYEAEQGLFKIAKETGMEVVIIRPPLVYGPGVKANFASMIKWVDKKMPLPFGAIDNKRSLVALDNLTNFIIHCIDHPKAANELFLISDGEDVSTTELLRKVARALGVKSILLPIPVSLMTFMAKLLGKGDVADRLFGSLQVDSAKAQDLLGWKPVVTMDEQLKKTADTYLDEKNN